MNGANSLTLRPFEDADKDLFCRWLGEEHIKRWYHSPSDWVTEIEKRQTEYSWIHHFIAEVDGIPVGFGQFYEYSRGGEEWHGNMDTSGAYSVDYLIGDAEYIGKGLGKKLILSLVKQISACYNAKLVIVQPEEANEASCRALLSAGFRFDEANRLFRLDLLGRAADKVRGAPYYMKEAASEV